jgi:ADP-ribose pyrophosphatase
MKPEERQEIYHGKRIQVVRDLYRGADGRTYLREIVLHPGAVVILAVDHQNRICLIRNRREAVGEELWEVPAGTLEGTEEPLTAAQRELQEETGFRARDWEKLAEFYPSPGVLSEKMHLYLAQNLEPGEQNLDVGERISAVEFIELPTALRWLQEGQLRDGKTLLAVLYWHHRNCLSGVPGRSDVREPTTGQTTTRNPRTDP